MKKTLLSVLNEHCSHAGRRAVKLFTATASKGKHLITIIALTAGLQVSAQANLYTFSQATGTYAPLATPTVLAAVVGTTVTPTDDANYTVALPFDFTYNSIAYTSGTNIRVNTNGYITFGTTASGTTNYTPLSATTGYAGAAAALGGDLSGSNVAANLGELSYQTTGTAPNRTLIVQWKNYVRYADAYIYGDLLNFQIHLQEGTNVIRFVYGNFTVATAASTTAQVGLRGASTVYHNRTTTTTWAASTQGAVATAAMPVTNAIKPAAGLTFTFTPPVPCTAPPTAGTAVATVPNGCTSVASTVLSLTGSQTGTGVTYQWQQSDTGVAGSYTNVTGTGTNATYTATAIAATRYYRALVTCSGQTTESAPAVITINTPTVTAVTLPYTQGFESWTSRCGNSEVPDASWRATPITGNNSWRRNDQGFTTAGWSYPADEPTPYTVPSSQGSYSARFHTFGTPVLNGTGTLDLFVDLSPAGTKTLTFDYINPTGTDKLAILLSSDGGVTFAATPILELGTSASFSGQSVTFTGLGANSVLRFRGTSDYGADDIGIDNLKLMVTPSCPGVAFQPVTSITETSATVNFTGNASANTYTFNYSPGGSPQTLLIAGPVQLSGLSPYTLYTVTISTNCAGGEVATATTTFRTAIGNNECEGAVALTPSVTPTPVTYTTSGATIGTTTGTCTAVPLAGDVWFSFVAAEPNTVITVVPTFDFNAVIELREGTCGGASISCQNASISGGGAGTETLNATGLTVGTTYLLRVYSAEAAPTSGNFDISVVSQAPAGTVDFAKNQLIYYPNPVTNELNIKGATAITEIAVYNIMGQKVLAQKGGSNEVRIDTSSLSAGTYIVNAASETAVKQFKIIKK